MKVFVPFRLREGADLRRSLNLEIVQAWWYTHGFEPIIVDDGGSGDDQFNRHKAYNAAVRDHKDVDVFVFTEADMLIHPDQINKAVEMARSAHGLVVPFTEYRYLSDSVTGFVRDTFMDMDTKTLAEWWSLPANDGHSIFDLKPESIIDRGKSIGAVNVVSRGTLNITGGFTEATRGNWYDDNIIEEGFAFLSRKTRNVKGPAVHLYHLPGHKGDHLTDEDRAATAHNKEVLTAVRRMIRQRDKVGVRRLLSHRVR